MSVDIFIQRFENGAPAPLSRDILERAFGPFIVERQPNSWRAVYSQTEEADIHLGAGETSDSVMISRPPRTVAFWRCLFRALEETDAVLFWPGANAGAVATNEKAVEQLPDDFVRKLGPPKIVRSAEEIAAHIT